MESAIHLKFLADALEDVSRHVELISGVDSDARSHLVFLLSGHDFSVGSADFDAGVETGAVVGVGDGASEGVFGADGAVVGALGAGGDSAFGPTEGSALIEVEEGEFLFETEK
jgi:hypothetical protein